MAVAVVVGTFDHAPDVIKRCNDLAIPTLVIGKPWLRRELGYWQVSLGKLNQPPPEAPSSDRFDKLRLKVHPLIKKPYHSVVVGQLVGPNETFKTEPEQVYWGRRAITSIKREFGRRKLFWRPHVDLPLSLGKPSIMTNPLRSIMDFVREEDVGSAVVYDSMDAIELLRVGVHVVAQGPQTVYTGLTSSDVTQLNRAHPGQDAVRKLLLRLAYGQYQVSELASWSYLERLLNLHGTTGDW